MPEQPTICLTVMDLFMVIGITALALAVAMIIFNLIRDRFLW